MQNHRIKILQVMPDLSAGGAETIGTNLGIGLSQLGAEVRFLLMAGIRGKRGLALSSCLRAAKIVVIGAREHSVRSPKNLVDMICQIRSWHPDIVHAHLYSAEVLTAAAQIFSMNNSTCYVRTLHNTHICSYRSKRIVQYLDRFYHLTVACSSSVADAYRLFMRSKCHGKLITIQNGGILKDAPTKIDEKLQSRSILGISDKAFVVSHIGRMDYGNNQQGGIESCQKAQDILLKAFARAFADNPQCLLILVGDGPLRPNLEALACRLGIAKQILFLGKLPNPWLALKAADMFFFPSRYEGMPGVLPEAASCGLPIVASDIPEIRSIAPGNTWVLLPVNDDSKFAEALCAVYRNRGEFASKAIAAAPSIRQQFSMMHCAKKYMQAYKSAINSRTADQTNI